MPCFRQVFEHDATPVGVPHFGRNPWDKQGNFASWENCQDFSVAAFFSSRCMGIHADVAGAWRLWAAILELFFVLAADVRPGWVGQEGGTG